jgi:hypothetical protein
MGELRNVHKIYLEDFNRNYRELRRKLKVTIKMKRKEIGLVFMNSFSSGQEPAAGPLEYFNEPSGSMKCGRFSCLTERLLSCQEEVYLL